MEKRYIFTLDVVMQSIIPHIEFVQGDTKVNVLEIELFNNDNAIDLTGTTIAMIFKKPDGHTVIGQAQITDAQLGKIVYELGTQEIACPGKVQAEVQIYGQDGKRLTSKEFYYYVRAQLDDGQAIESTTEYPILTSLISELNALRPQGEGLPGQVLMMGEDGVIRWQYITLDNGVIE